MTFSRPSLSQLIDRAEADIAVRLPGADARLRRSVLAVLARTHAGAVDGLYGHQGFLARQLMPDTAEAEYLDRWATIWGVPRKAAAAAAGVVTVTGVTGAIIGAGVLLARVDGALFATNGRAVLVGGTAQIAVTAIAAGVAGVTPAGAQLTFASPVSGVTAIAITAAGLGGGADEEADSALLARLLTRIRTPPQGGSRSDFVAWALTYPAASRAWCYQDWMGPGTVGVTFVCEGRADIIPLQADLDAMAALLEPLRPVAAKAVVFSPTPQPVDLLIGATPDNGEVRAAIVEELADLFRREAEPGGTIYLSRINEAISLAAGEYDHRTYSPAADITAPAGSLPMLGTVRWQ